VFPCFFSAAIYEISVPPKKSKLFSHSGVAQINVIMTSNARRVYPERRAEILKGELPQNILIAAGCIVFVVLAVIGLILTSRRKNRG
jgi:hypothetical protein